MSTAKLTHRVFRKLVGYVIDNDGAILESVQVALTFYPKRPFELLLSIACRMDDCPDCFDDIEWTFAVDLLRDGVHQLAGLGDVQIWPGDGVERWPDAGTIRIRLSSPEGVATISMARAPMLRFIAAVEERVPRGTEQMEIPSFVPATLDGAW